ncbi:Ca2+-binding RTX toxin-like protein [Bradyrhizobium sp. AZCC 1578]
MTVVRNATNAILLIGTDGIYGGLIIGGQFTSDGKISAVQFDDGTIWTDQMLLANAIANDGADLTHSGTGGSDTIYGTSDIDVIDGRAGDDILRGSGGSDTYRWGAGSGSDTIVEDSGESDVDAIRLLGLNPSDVALSRLDNHLYITINATGEVLKVQDHFDSTSYGVEQIRFADNTNWDRAQILAAAWFIGTSAGETIDGSSGNDTIDGRAGSDRLIGHGGADTYLFGVGSGNDTIAEGSVASDGSGDVVKLVNLNIADVEFSRSGNDLYIKIASSGETLKVENQFDGDSGIEVVAFADGTVLDKAAIKAAAIESGVGYKRCGNADRNVGRRPRERSWRQRHLAGGKRQRHLHLWRRLRQRCDFRKRADAGTDNIKLVGLNASDVEFMRWDNNLYVTILATGERVQVNNQILRRRRLRTGYVRRRLHLAPRSDWIRRMVTRYVRQR